MLFGNHSASRNSMACSRVARKSSISDFHRTSSFTESEYIDRPCRSVEYLSSWIWMTKRVSVFALVFVIVTVFVEFEWGFSITWVKVCIETSERFAFIQPRDCLPSSEMRIEIQPVSGRVVGHLFSMLEAKHHSFPKYGIGVKPGYPTVDNDYALGVVTGLRLPVVHSAPERFDFLHAASMPGGH